MNKLALENLGALTIILGTLRLDRKTPFNAWSNPTRQNFIKPSGCRVISSTLHGFGHFPNLAGVLTISALNPVVGGLPAIRRGLLIPICGHSALK